jgi:hypothetical protein
VLGDTPANLVFSNKKMDTVVQSKGHVTFNLASSKDAMQALHREHPDSILCSKDCGKCGWKCYTLEEGMVIEEVNRKHGRIPEGL